MRILKDKKGAAIETAIVFLILIFSFCFILTATSLLGVKRARLEKEKNALIIEREQITEDFLSYVKDPNDADSFLTYTQNKYEGYEITDEQKESDTISLTVKKNGEVVLYLCAGKDSDGNAVLKYCKTTQ